MNQMHRGENVPLSDAPRLLDVHQQLPLRRR